jgi:hypothetical protein
MFFGENKKLHFPNFFDESVFWDKFFWTMSFRIFKLPEFKNRTPIPSIYFPHPKKIDQITKKTLNCMFREA